LYSCRALVFPDLPSFNDSPHHIIAPVTRGFLFMDLGRAHNPMGVYYNIK